jgi:hypothetical protein
MSEEENNDYIGGEFEEMDLTDLEDEVFLVACNTGDLDKPKFIPESICGPFDFYEMCETVGNWWIDQQIHAKAMIPSKTMGEPPKVLDPNTIDYIEARFEDILAEGLLSGRLLEDKEFTCKAGFIDIEEDEEEGEEQE